ncbi:MAG TPA: pantoate--beta-alanine ligase [Lentisphaeria bacterium]|nr:pantoate--beta-alanine ligase [Lentisphaeria bacterium]HCG49371.1 pantoate--beta-alanine ligase [Lentisphaeria bacterium]
MQVIKTIREMQKWSMDRKKAGKTVAVVPTMGFLHEGHLSLIDAARANGADAVVVTIFVNPIQFAPNEDFDSYPRDFEHDAALLREKNVDAVFAPAVSEMYPAPVTCMVIENKLSKGLCAKTRPTHFNGVTTVVAKLFNATLPDIAVFGQKDAQQARVLKRMVRDLNFPIRMVVAPIVREADGLAKSSRNKYLSEDERARALVLSRSLLAAKEMAEKGEKDLAKLTDFIRKEIEAQGGKVDYVEAIDSEELEPVTVRDGKPVMIALAAYFGTTRLIDNIVF